MSCDSNSIKVGNSAGKTAGISTLAGKLSHTAGAMLARLDRAGDRLGRAATPISGAVLDAVDRQGVVARIARDPVARNVATGAAGAAITIAGNQALRDGGRSPMPARASRADDLVYFLGLRGPFRKAAPTVFMAWWIAKSAHRTTATLGGILGRATQGERSETVRARRPITLFGLKLGETGRKTSVWESGMTHLLNRADLLGSHQLGQGVRSSDGVTFDAGGLTWHRGTSVIDTPDGERTITHLQSLSLPADHYYFDRPLDDARAIEIAAKTVRPENIPGYVGQVSSLEALTPGWAMAKRAMITSQLYWGGSRPTAQPGSDQKAAQPAAASEAVRA